VEGRLDRLPHDRRCRGNHGGSLGHRTIVIGFRPRAGRNGPSWAPAWVTCFQPCACFRLYKHVCVHHVRTGRGHNLSFAKQRFTHVLRQVMYPFICHVRFYFHSVSSFELKSCFLRV
jgi:hypothetical protein